MHRRPFISETLCRFTCIKQCHISFSYQPPLCFAKNRRTPSRAALALEYLLERWPLHGRIEFLCILVGLDVKNASRQTRTQQKWPWHCEQVMWLQPPFRWMGAPQPVQGLVCLVTHDSLWDSAAFCASLSMACHSRTCGKHICWSP